MLVLPEDRLSVSVDALDHFQGNLTFLAYLFSLICSVRLSILTVRAATCTCADPVSPGTTCQARIASCVLAFISSILLEVPCPRTFRTSGEVEGTSTRGAAWLSLFGPGKGSTVVAMEIALFPTEAAPRNSALNPALHAGPGRPKRFMLAVCVCVQRWAEVDKSGPIGSSRSVRLFYCLYTYGQQDKMRDLLWIIALCCCCYCFNVRSSRWSYLLPAAAAAAAATRGAGVGNSYCYMSAARATLTRFERKAMKKARSYRRKQGPTTPRQREALRSLLPIYGLSLDSSSRVQQEEEGGYESVPWPLENGSILDIGFGKGESTCFMASCEPSTLVVGIEVHRPGLAAALLRVHEEGIKNVRFACGDALTCLADHIPPGSLKKVCIFFPDPFPKTPERRIVRPLLMQLLSTRVEGGGCLHIATDVEDYALHSLKVCSSSQGWAGGMVERPLWRAVTGYETAAVSEGRKIFDLQFTLSQ
jgi:tRNA (guanine-N7-)-methyltransferase